MPTAATAREGKFVEGAAADDGPRPLEENFRHRVRECGRYSMKANAGIGATSAALQDAVRIARVPSRPGRIVEKVLQMTMHAILPLHLPNQVEQAWAIRL